MFSKKQLCVGIREDGKYIVGTSGGLLIKRMIFPLWEFNTKIDADNFINDADARYQEAQRIRKLKIEII